MSSMTVFFKQLLDPGYRVTADVYAYMFLCDFFNFMVVIFGFSAFGVRELESIRYFSVICLRSVPKPILFF